jgi:hypothetical protein
MLVNMVKDLQSEVKKLKPESEDRWMDVDELRAYLPGNPARQTIYAKGDKIPRTRNGKSFVYRKSEIDEWIKNGGWTEEPGDVLVKRKRRA